MAVAISVALQGSWPPRQQVTVTGLSVTDVVSVYRTVDGDDTLIRPGAFAVTDTSYVLLDAEMPFGKNYTYHVKVNSTYYTSSTQNVALPGGKVAISDAVSGLKAEVVISAWPEKIYAKPFSLFKVGGRNVVVSGSSLGQFSTTIELVTETEAGRVSLFEILDDPTEGVLLLRSADATTYDGVNAYLAITGATERRYSQRGSDQRRFWQLDVIEVEPWTITLTATGFTLADINAAYTGLTLANLAADYSTLLDIAQADWS